MPIIERPILFRDEMVKAILSDAKTQTRRIIKPQPGQDIDALHGHDLRGRAPYRIEDNETGNIIGWGFEDDDGVIYRCRFKAGEHLWVREGVIQIGHERTGKNGQYLWPKFANEADAKRWFDDCCHYTADLKYDDPLFVEPLGRLNKMFMPQWASRITLEIVGVKVERIQDVTSANIRAEGISCPQHDPRSGCCIGYCKALEEKFAETWKAINSGQSWNQNDWVWVIEFKRIKP